MSITKDQIIEAVAAMSVMDVVELISAMEEKFGVSAAAAVAVAAGPVEAAEEKTEFCKAFNAKTDSIEKGLPIPVVITVYADRSFTFVTKTPPAAVLLKKAAGIKSGSGKPNKDKVGKISRAQLQEIAQTKAADMTGADIEAMTRSIEGTARSMGLVVED